MTIPQILVIISAIISISGAYAYISDTIKGKTKPNLVSWSMWALAPLIATGAAISVGADPWATVRIFLAGFLPLLVVIFALANPQSYWKLTSFDIACGITSFVAILVWAAFGAAKEAILLAALADAFASLPTIRKAWNFPETETGATYIASFISVLIILPSIPVWNIENSAFQITILTINAILVTSIYRKRVMKKLGLKIA